MTSPPATLSRACADGAGRLRIFRARRVPVGFLVLAASCLACGLGMASSTLAQFPIRQIPGPPSAPAAASTPGFGGAFPEAAPGSTARGPYAAGTDVAASRTVRDLAAWAYQPHPAVARIVVPERDGISLGSGTLVDVRGDFGLVVTNWHVVRDAAGPIQVEFPGGFQSPGEVVKTDKDWDLAALSIRRPPATPVPISPHPPRPGQWLAIAGYGSGTWRMVSGPCTQYLAPGAAFPYELVELAAEARQGDSGGPIFNERGELAGVLFGSGPGYTSGSYGGRVLQFLASVVPGGVPGGDFAPPSPPTSAVLGLAAQPAAEAGSLGSPGAAALAQRFSGGRESGEAPRSEGVITPPPQATALHTFPLASSMVTAAPPSAGEPPDRKPGTDFGKEPASTRSEPLTPARTGVTADAGALAVPAASGSTPPASGLWPVSEAEHDPRVAVAPTGRVHTWPDPSRPLSSRTSPAEDASPAELQAELPPRSGARPTHPDPSGASAEELWVIVWRRLAGETLYDQTKTILALIGLLALAVLLLRRPSAPPPYDE